jgi:hypothetical protein
MAVILAAFDQSAERSEQRQPRNAHRVGMLRPSAGFVDKRLPDIEDDNADRSAHGSWTTLLSLADVAALPQLPPLELVDPERKPPTGPSRRARPSAFATRKCSRECAVAALRGLEFRTGPKSETNALSHSSSKRHPTEEVIDGQVPGGV